MQILFVEDDRRISEFLVKGLEEQGFTVTLSTTGIEARDLIFDNNWDVIILDIMLPDIDGIQLTKLTRYRKIITPILILSALSEPDDKIAALDSGADDYLVKPFHFKELLSRINALTRRSKYSQKEGDNSILEVGKLSINLDKFEVRYNDDEIKLSPREFKLLVYLCENRNKVVRRSMILNEVWGINYDNNTNVVDVYISYLRSKIAFDESCFISTIKGIGYMLEDKNEYSQ